MSSKLKEKWSRIGKDIRHKRYVFVKFPKKDSHQGHLIGEVCIACV